MIRGRTANLLLGLDVNVGRTAALVTLSGDDLVVVRTQTQTGGRPGVEVVLHGDGAADALGGADGPVLVEGRGALDGRLVVAGGEVDVVGAAVALERALVLRVGARVVGAVGLNHVVLDQRVVSPAVHGQVPVAARVERTAVVDGAGVKCQSEVSQGLEKE